MFNEFTVERHKSSERIFAPLNLERIRLTLLNTRQGEGRRADPIKDTQNQKWKIDDADTIVDLEASSKVGEMPLRNDLTSSLQMSLSPSKMREMGRRLIDGADLHSGDGLADVVVFDDGDVMMAGRFFIGPDDPVPL